MTFHRFMIAFTAAVVIALAIAALTVRDNLAAGLFAVAAALSTIVLIMRIRGRFAPKGRHR